MAQVDGVMKQSSAILGSFDGEDGMRYVLDVEFLDDGSALAMADPHLKVEVTAAFYDDALWGQLDWFWPWVTVAFLGLVLLIADIARSWWRNRLTVS
jgi:hypothetical protein